MTATQYISDDRQVIWLTVDYSPPTGLWFITTTDPSLMNRNLAKEFTAVEGVDIVYMIRGFDDSSDAKGFATTYHKAKQDGIVHRARLD